MWHGKKPDILHLQEFGCDVWILTEEMKMQSKIEAHTMKMTFVGFEDGPGAVQFCSASKWLISVSHNVWFNENDVIACTKPDHDLDLSPLDMGGRSLSQAPIPVSQKTTQQLRGRLMQRRAILCHQSPSTFHHSFEPISTPYMQDNGLSCLEQPKLPSKHNTNSARETDAIK